MADAGVADGIALAEAVIPGPGLDMTHGQALAYLRVTARKCLVDFLLEQFSGDLSGPAGYACCYIVDAVSVSSQLLSGARLRDLAAVSVLSSQGRLSLGSLLPSHPQYFGAHAHFFIELETSPSGEALHPVYVSGVCRQIIGAAYELVHPRLSVGAPSAHDAVAEVAEPLWSAALVATLTKLTGSSPARSAKACTAVEVSMAIRLFNEATQLMITFSDVAGPVACKAILDQLAQGTIGFESRCAPCNVKPWAGVDGTSIKEKQDKYQQTDEGLEVRSSLEVDFPAGITSLAVCAQYELWFRTIHVLSYLVPGRPGFVTLGVWNAIITRMREACPLHTGKSLLMLVTPLIRRGVAAVNLVSVVPPDAPVMTFDAAFLTILAQIDSALVLSASVIVAFQSSAYPGSSGTSPATVSTLYLAPLCHLIHLPEACRCEGPLAATPVSAAGQL
jgi:hypothetical protein